MKRPLAGVQVTELAGDDAVRPFEVKALDVRGRAVQLSTALDGILSRHDYPEPIARLVSEAIALAALLGSSLKFSGKFSIQTDTDGPVRTMVAEFRTPGDLRAYVGFDRERVAAATAAGEAQPGLLLGHGHLSMIIDQGPDMTSYRGVVELHGQSLEDAAHTYFRQSEQIPTRVRLAAAEIIKRDDGKMRRSWRAGGLVAQFLPAAPERMRQPDLPGGDAPAGASLPTPDAPDDAWDEARILVDTVEDHELLDPDVPVERLLYRLFHERGVRVFDPAPVHDKCSCSRDRIENLLRSFSAKDVRDSIEDGRIRVTCEFCGTRYDFDPAEFEQND